MTTSQLQLGSNAGLQPRPYQREAVDAIYGHFHQSAGNPLVVLPTGTGKSLCIALFLSEVLNAWPGQRAVVLAHVQELIEQNYRELMELWPWAPAGLYSAGLKRRDTDDSIIFGGIQSIWRQAEALQKIDLVLIDEAHMTPRQGHGMYRHFLAQLRSINPALKVIGFTATPERLDSGRLDEGEDALFERIVYDYSIRRAIDEGYLAPLVSPAVDTEIDVSGVAKRGGEFVQGALGAACDVDDVNAAIVEETIRRGADRRSWLLFAASVLHAEHVGEELRRRGVRAAVVTGETSRGEREEAKDAFRSGRIRALVNVDVFTTGFNVPGVDLIAMLRPTMSRVLYIQMGGRGTRRAPGKTNCLVLDFAGNIRRHGPIDAFQASAPRSPKDSDPSDAPAKLCPDCRHWIHAGVRLCPECGHEFPAPDATAALDRKPETAPILATMDDVLKRNAPKEVAIEMSEYFFHAKKGKSDAPPTMRAEHWEGTTIHREWVCFEHEGFARRNAERWWIERGGDLPVPATVEEAVLRQRELRDPLKLLVGPDPKIPKFTRIVRVVELGERAAPPPQGFKPSLQATLSDLDLAKHKKKNAMALSGAALRPAANPQDDELPF